MAVSFIGGRNRSTLRKPPTCTLSGETTNTNLSLLFDQNEAQTHDIPHLRRARSPLHQQCMLPITSTMYASHYINNVCSPLHQQCTLPITSTMYAPHYINNVCSPLHQQCMLPITSTMWLNNFWEEGFSVYCF